jgi:hypothetical protein
MKMDKLVRLCVMVTVVAIIFGAYASNSYGQETSTTNESTAPANPLPPTAYVNAGKGYKIGGNVVLTTPGGSGSSGIGNVGLGYQALISNTTGSDNTASGHDALARNTTGSSNSAVGWDALAFNTTGSGNTANGYDALLSNTTGSTNSAVGWEALSFNSTGSGNTATGFQALYANTRGSGNTASGYDACYNLKTGSNVICIGNSVGPAGDIPGPATYIGGIYGAPTTGSGNPLVCIDSTGLLGTTNCATNGAPSAQQEVIEHQQVQIETLQRQNEELQQRMSRLESLIAKK